MGITTLEQLRDHLQFAIMLEHTTIPAYLCVTYTIRPDANAEAAFLVRSVVVQEMLHLTLAANILNAVGGEPSLDDPRFVPEYPQTIPFTDIAVSLMPFGVEAIEMCALIEHPGPEHGVRQDVAGLTYGSVEEFYQAIRDGIAYLCLELGPSNVFTGDPGRQVGTESFYGAAGALAPVVDERTADAAIATIVDQGEGMPQSVFDDDRLVGEAGELGHYFRFRELLLGRRYQVGDTPASGPTGAPIVTDWNAAYPMATNPKVADYPEGSEARRRATEFNVAYGAMCNLLHKAFNGRPELFQQAVVEMYGLRDRANALVRNPFPGRSGVNAGPTFEIT